MLRHCNLAVLALLGACGAGPNPGDSAQRELPMDVHSHSRPNEVAVTHADFDLTLDFAQRSILGRGRLSLARRVAAAPLVLDAADGLEILAVRGVDGIARTFARSSAHPVLGSAVTIELGRGDRAIDVEWRVTAASRAVQWLDPAQTRGKVAPFLFTQGQAILTRTWLPLQDSPGVRMTWNATVRIPDSPVLTALMSAEDREVVEPGVTRFAMTQPVPPYLIALGVGRLSRAEISARCAVWAEPELVEVARNEFEDTESMIATVEGLYGPYRFGRYDILVLPPSFPFGGMENPCLTFATPTILAGDKSLVALIAHELAHSWSGNLVTNATWRDFWLNEGFTVYVEQRIVEAIFGAERARAETRNGIAQLEAELKELAAPDQRLHLELDGRNPDDALTAVAYEKGAAFLRRIEVVVGRDRFDPFLRAWFDENAFQSRTTADFLAFFDARLFAHLTAAERNSIDVDRWVHQPGLPDDCPRPQSVLLDEVDAAIAAFAQGTAAGAVAATRWSTTQWLHFLNALPDELSRARLRELDVEFGLTATNNAEIAFAWMMRNLAAGYDGLDAAIDAKIEAFLSEVGRRKYVRPLFGALARTDSGRARANAIYQRARDGYHAVTRDSVDALLRTTGN
jgi:aminopeptidase N